MSISDDEFLRDMKKCWEELDPPHRTNYWTLLRIIDGLGREVEGLKKAVDAAERSRDHMHIDLNLEIDRLKKQAASAEEALKAIWPFIEEDEHGAITPGYRAAIKLVKAQIKPPA